jgi:hypothetical protein
VRTAGPRVLQDALDQRFHAVHAGAHEREHLARVVRKRVVQVLLDPLREIGDAAKRRAQVVRGGVGKRIQLPIAAFERGGERRECLRAAPQLFAFTLGTLALVLLAKQRERTLLGVAPVGDVLRRPAHLHRRPVLVADHRAAPQDPPLSPVGQHNPVFHDIGIPSVDGLRDELLQALAIVGLQPVDVRGVREWLTRIEPPDPEELLGPFDPIGRKVPFPRTDVRDPLRFAQLLFAPLELRDQRIGICRRDPERKCPAVMPARVFSHACPEYVQNLVTTSGR